MPTFSSHASRSGGRAAAASGPRGQMPVPLTVTALEITAGRLTHLRGLHHAGLPWRLAVDDAIAAIQSRRYSLGVRSGRERCLLVRRDDLERGFEALDRSGRDLLLELPVIASEPPRFASALPFHPSTSSTHP